MVPHPAAMFAVQMLQHLNAQCAMGNSIFSYAALSGSAEMIEAAVGRFPLNQVVDDEGKRTTI